MNYSMKPMAPKKKKPVAPMPMPMRGQRTATNKSKKK